MGFIIEIYQLYGLPPLPNIYVSIKGSYAVKKLLDTYIITFTTCFSASKADPVVTQKEMSFSVQLLPSPADLYSLIYENIKLTLDSAYRTPQQTLQFVDDVSSSMLLNKTVAFSNIIKIADASVGTVATIGTSATIDTSTTIDTSATIDTSTTIDTSATVIDTTINTTAIDQDVVDEAKQRYEEMRIKAEHYRTSSGRIRIDIPEDKVYPIGVFSPPSEPGSEPELVSVATPVTPLTPTTT
jgi:hypothetical protein